MRTKHFAWLLFLLVGTLSISACGDDGGGGGNPDGGTNPGADGGGTNPGTDGGTNPGTDGGTNPGIDGGVLPPPGCGEAGATQCNNCMDDDGDGLTDGQDPHCISALDDDEFTFATGIPGDNRDPKQDCFFDGDSGDGNDDCNLDICCLLGTCPDGFDCTVSQQCKDVCGPAAPPGCDCFGCCTVCHEGTCKDILTVPDSTPEWDCNNLDNLSDDAKCPVCVKAEGCGTACDEAEQNDDCILCPGQSPDDLPAECSGARECPDGLQVCATIDDCPEAQYCATGCCIDIVIE